jgi:hypothetical protein
VPRTTHSFEELGVDKSQNPCVGIFLGGVSRGDRRCALSARAEPRQASLLPTDQERPGCVYGAREQAGRRRGGSNHESSLRDARDARRLGCAQLLGARTSWVRAARRVGKAKRASAARARRNAPCLTYAADAAENVASAHPASRRHTPTVTREHGEKPRRRAGADLHSSRGLRDREEDQNL